MTIMVWGRGSSSLEAKHSAQMYAACSFRNVITASWSFKSATPADRLLIQCQARKNCRRTIFHEIREPDRISDWAFVPSCVAGATGILPSAYRCPQPLGIAVDNCMDRARGASEHRFYAAWGLFHLASAALRAIA